MSWRPSLRRCRPTLAWLNALKTHLPTQMSHYAELFACRLDLSRTLLSPETQSLLASMDHLEEVVLPYAIDAEYRSLQVRGQLSDSLLLNSRLRSQHIRSDALKVDAGQRWAPTNSG